MNRIVAEHNKAMQDLRNQLEQIKRSKEVAETAYEMNVCSKKDFNDRIRVLAARYKLTETILSIGEW